jgi:hypothetical protein
VCHSPRTWVPRVPTCAIFGLGLGVLLISLGSWEGVIPLAAAVLIFRTRYILRQSAPS